MPQTFTITLSDDELTAMSAVTQDIDGFITNITAMNVESYAISPFVAYATEALIEADGSVSGTRLERVAEAVRRGLIQPAGQV